MNSSMEKPYVVGIDIGGTNTVFGIVDARGTIIASGAVKTQVYPTVEEYADEVCKNLLPLIIANGGVDKIKGIGIGAPNGNYYTGTIEFAPNLPWKGVLPLASMFEERLGIPTALTNDANAAAVGEMTYGAARGMKDFIMITLGTGVGSGIVINGQVVYGHDGFAGELGHVIVRRDGRICGCGRKGCLETTARLQVWHALHVNSSLHVPMPACCVISRLRALYRKTYTMQPYREINWLRRFSNLQVIFWVKHWQTLLLSRVRKLLSCSVVWQNRVITL